MPLRHRDTESLHYTLCLYVCSSSSWPGLFQENDQQKPQHKKFQEKRLPYFSFEIRKTCAQSRYWRVRSSETMGNVFSGKTATAGFLEFRSLCIRTAYSRCCVWFNQEIRETLERRNEKTQQRRDSFAYFACFVVPLILAIKYTELLGTKFDF